MTRNMLMKKFLRIGIRGSLLVLIAASAYATSVETLLDALGKGNRREVAGAYTEMAGFSDAKLSAAVRDGLKREDPKISAHMIGLIRDRELKNFYSQIEKYTTADDSSLRYEAFLAVVNFKGRGSLPLARIMATDIDEEIRRYAIDTMVDYGNEKDIEHVKEGLNREPLGVKIHAAIALTRKNIFVGREIAISGIESSSSTVRTEAIKLLGLIGSPGDRALLQSIVDDRHAGSFHRVEALFAINQLDLRSSPPESKNAFLESKLSDPKSGVRKWAAKQLLLRHKSGGLESLKRVSKSSLAGSKEADEALKAVGTLQWKRAFEE